MKTYILSSFTLLFSFLFVSCLEGSKGTDANSDTARIDRATVAENYANLVLANYKDAFSDAAKLQQAIDAFISNPTEQNFNATKATWLKARETYGTSEAFRFANGPIDSGETEDLESWLNSWPLDEAYVDYVEGNELAGLINDRSFVISKAALVDKNGSGGEENVSIGYHAIEFLLWGQDLTTPSQNQSGMRPYTDFVDGGTASNQDRRRLYLSLCADLITDHLQVLIDEWSGAYRTTFMALDHDRALDQIIRSISELSRSELAIERMAVALQNQDQEDEHSCFSDNTHRDIRQNWQGIVNVYKGRYDTIEGNSLAQLIEEADPQLAGQLSRLLLDAQTKVERTTVPFDKGIAGGPQTTEGKAIMEAIQALVAFGDKLLEARPALGIS